MKTLRRCKRIGANEATSETAVPEGRQAEWNGALSRSEIKKGRWSHSSMVPSLNPSPPTQKGAREGRLYVWVKMDSNHRSRKTADLQSAPFGHSGIHPA